MTTHPLMAMALLLAFATPAAAQSTPRIAIVPGSDGGRASDAAWSPPSYGLATAGDAAAVAPRGLGTAGGTTPAPTTPTIVEQPPQPTTLGKWVASVQCDGTLQVCGFASQSRGWGFAVWNQHWECDCDVCGPLPATVAANGGACQTSMGNLGYVFGPQCVLGKQAF